MSKTQQEIQSLLGLTGNETLAELITVLNSYATVTDTELNNIKNISVQTLPTIVRNQEQLVKGRIHNPSTNDTQGIPAVLNKRIVLIKLITDKITTELTKAVAKLNGISTGANKVEQSQTNGNIKIDGVEKTVYTLPKASATTVGGVKEGNGVDIAQDGTITVNKQEIGLEIVSNEVVQRKLDKVPTTNVVYGTDSQGNQTTYGVSENVENNKLVKRTNTGKINLPNSVTLGQNTFATIEQLLDGIVAFISNLSQEVGDLEGTDTSFTETVTALQDRVTELETSWTTFMAGTDADNITDTLLSVQTDIENLKTAVEGLENYDDTEVRGLITTETSRATSQENKSLYHLGAFDSADGKTRQTSVLYGKNLSSLSVAEYTNITYYKIPKPTSASDYGNYSYNAINNKYPKYDGSNWNSTECIGKISGYAETANYWVGFTKGTTQAQALADFQDLILQYKLATAYTEQVIEGESILPLDSNMANKIRQDVVDSLNTFNFDIFNKKSFTTSGNTYSQFTFEVWNDSSLTSQETVFRIWYDGSYPDNKTATISTSKTYYCRIGINGNVADNKTSLKQIYIKKGTYTFSGLFTTINANAYTFSGLMFNAGSHPYPYEPYHARKHITDEEATLLKEETVKCRNLLPNSKGISGSGQTVLTEVVNLPIGTYTIKASGGTYSGAMSINVVYADGTSGGNIVAGNVGTALTFTTTKVITQFLIYCNSTISNVNFMLNEGSTAQPYQEWNGEIVHEKQLQEVKESLEERINEANNEVVAQIPHLYQNFISMTASMSLLYNETILNFCLFTTTPISTETTGSVITFDELLQLIPEGGYTYIPCTGYLYNVRGNVNSIYKSGSILKISYSKNDTDGTNNLSVYDFTESGAQVTAFISVQSSMLF